MKIKLRNFKECKMKVSHIFAAVLALVLMVATGSVAEAQGSRNNQFDEVGLFLGVGYYNGEINPKQPFYKSQFAFGFNLRHGFNERMALTFQASRCKVKGDDADFSDLYRKARGAKFENEITELAFSFEYNFLPLVKGSPTQCVTPFVAAGAGVCMASFPNEGLQACIPFGLGVKIAPLPRLCFSLEWKYRKLFSDMLDHIGEDTYAAELGGATKQKSFLGDKDWYAFAGVVISYQMSKSGGNSRLCPAYRK